MGAEEEGHQARRHALGDHARRQGPRILSPDRTDARTHSLDLYQQEIPAGGRSGKHWHMADEAVYVISGKGHSLQWDVEAEIDDKYYARIAKEPTRWEFSGGDLLYVPQNTVHQHFNADPKEPLILLSAQNRLYKHLGYDNVDRYHRPYVTHTTEVQ